ncbi:hypothetical protein IAU60_002532 [Kwoniella sp. DSM 27419]
MTPSPQHQQKTPSRPSDYQKECYLNGLHGVRPSYPFHNRDWPTTAKGTLSANAWGYVNGNAGVGSTHDANIKAFNDWQLIPKRLVAANKDPEANQAPDLSVKVLGLDLPCPIMVAPVGVLKIFHSDGECGVAKAANACGVPYIMSTASATSIEQVAKASGDGTRFFQLYWPERKDDDITISILKRAKENGFKALFVTLDTYILGWRPDDMQHGFNPWIGVHCGVCRPISTPSPTFLPAPSPSLLITVALTPPTSFYEPNEVGVEIGFSDPVFRAKYKKETGREIEEDLPSAAMEWSQKVFPSVSHTWDDLEFLKRHWDGPIVLKGIQTVEDAQEAVKRGMQGIVVSNHGGRQVDGSVPSLDVLPEIVKAVGNDLDILFDSGIRTGPDVAKALALGAKAVLVGRPFVYGLAFGGEKGVEHVLKCLLGDLDLTMTLSGIYSVQQKDLNERSLRRAKGSCTCGH